MNCNIEKMDIKYTELFEYSLDLVYVYDIQGNLLYANNITILTLGYTKEELYNLSLMDLLDKEQHNLVIEASKNLIKRGKQSIPHEYKIIKKDGTYLYLETYGIPIRSNGNIAFLVIGKDITKQKLAEERLIESEKRFSTAFYLNSNLMAISNLENGTYIDVNDAFLKTIQTTREEIIGKSAKILYEDPSIRDFLIKELKEKGKVVNYELKFKTINGDPLIGLFSFDLVKMNGKQYLISVANDITERKIAEQKLKESEEKYRHLFESSPDSITLLDLEGKIIDVNPATNQFLYLQKTEDLNGRHFKEIFLMKEQKPFVAIIEETFKKILKGEVTEAIEFPLSKPDGSYQWINLQGSLIKIGDKPMIQFIGKDITENKKAEQELKKSEEKYRLLFEYSPNSIVLTDNKGTILDYNPEAEKMFEISKNELIGKHYSFLTNSALKNNPLFKKRYENSLKGEPLTSIELRFRKKDGNLAWAKYQSSTIITDNETLVQAFMEDITDRKKAEILVEEELKKLKELDRIRRDLITRISHELKTPLIPVISGSELLTTIYKDQIGKDALEIIQMIDRGGARLRELVETLVNVSQIEYNKFELKRGKHDLSTLIKECTKDIKYILESRNLALHIDIPDNFYLEIDKLRTAEVITNLLSNAMKNTPPKGSIKINLRKKKTYAVLTVSDTGVGLTKNEMNLLFSRFGKIERYKEGLEYLDIKGSGLGLYLCKVIIDLHGGKIWAQSDGRNKGSKFTFILPITPF